jgi:hypothetical protein
MAVIGRQSAKGTLDDCVCTDHWELPILVRLSPIQDLLKDPLQGSLRSMRSRALTAKFAKDSATSLRKPAAEIVQSS